jgi:signal peptidase I
VVGRAFVIVAPVSRWRVLPIPVTFQQPRLAQAAGPAAPDALPVLSAPVASAVPLGFGLAGAVPLTWLQLRLRRRLAGMRRGRSPPPRPRSRRRGDPGRPGRG